MDDDPPIPEEDPPIPDFEPPYKNYDDDDPPIPEEDVPPIPEEEEEYGNFCLETVNLSSTLDVFNAVYKRVIDKGHESQFLSILQHFLRIDLSPPIGVTMLNTVRTVVDRLTMLESVEQCENLLKCIEPMLEGNEV